ncbi:hypothetical protein V5T82_09415 [Magnetovibrio sp. PR-2]|uniref:hypothetical protein n=1 Tax=Magnetovibrio sp. PR-2 TaxID=3120356 RepID=UPI002FCE5D38
MSDDIDPQEQAKFLALLRRSETDAIVQKLDDNTIIRDWKRQLAENEVERRKGRGGSQPKGGGAHSPQTHAAAQLKGWIITGVLIVCAVLIAYVYIADQMSN